MSARAVIGMSLAGALAVGGLVPSAAGARTLPDAMIAFEEVDEGRSVVGVLPVRVKGELPPSAAEEMRSIIFDNLSADDVAILDSSAVDAELGEGEVCEDTQCRVRLAGAIGADYLVAGRIEGNEDEFSVKIVLVDGATGEEVAPFVEECTICGFVEVRDMVRMRALDARAEVIRRAEIAVARPEVDPATTKDDPVDDRPAPRSKLIPTGWALIGAGAAAVVGGVVLLALHRRDAGCLDNPRGGDCVPLRYTTAAPGGGVLGAGVLAAGGGVVMLVLGRRAEQRSRSQVSVGPRGVAWRLRF